VPREGYPVRESGGLVWVFLLAGDSDEVEPMPLPYTSRKDSGTLYRRVDMPGSLPATIENALDVSHTAFLHSVLFRGKGEPRDIAVIVRRSGECLEAEYAGEASPTGLMATLGSRGWSRLDSSSRGSHKWNIA
jgi:phenylpropionate dioxygenase-like ring-hydroxylating dioxygenase large terminal subunit